MKTYSIIMSVFFSIFFTLACLLMLVYSSFRKIKNETLYEKKILDSLIIENEQKSHFKDSVTWNYIRKINEINKEGEYYLIKQVKPIIVKSRTTPSSYKIYFLASFDDNYFFDIALGSKLDTNTLELSGIYKTISIQQKMTNYIELNKADIKRPVVGTIRIGYLGPMKLYPINEDFNIIE